MAHQFIDPGQKHIEQDDEHIYEYYLPLDTKNGRRRSQLQSQRVHKHMLETRVYELEETGARGRLIRTVPNFEAIIKITEMKLPRFLYRTSFDKSAGHSTGNEFLSQSALCKERYETDFTRLKIEDMQHSIYLHLLGYRSSHGQTFHSPWISFTDSWAFVMYWALYHRSKGCAGVKIHVVDTHSIREPALVFHSFMLVKALKVGARLLPVQWYKKMIGGTYTEFLVWNSLKVDTADVVELATVFNAEIGPAGLALIRPSTIHVFNVRVHKCINGEVTRKVDCPAVLRKRLFDDEAHLKWLEEAGRGPGTYRYMRNSMRATRMKQASPPSWYKKEHEKVMRKKFPVSNSMINAALDIAWCFKPQFRMDITMWTLALRAATYDKEDLAEKLAAHITIRQLMRGVTCYVTGQDSYKKKEVQIYQEIWLDMATLLGAPVVFNGSSGIRRNLVPIKNCPDTTKPRQLRMAAAAGNRSILDKSRSFLNEPQHDQEILCNTQAAPSNDYNNKLKRKPAESLAESGQHHSHFYDAVETPYKRARFCPTLDNRASKIIFFPEVDSFTIDGNPHEGIDAYIDTVAREHANVLPSGRMERMRYLGSLADEGNCLLAGDEEQIEDEGEMDQSDPLLLKEEPAHLEL